MQGVIAVGEYRYDPDQLLFTTEEGRPLDYRRFRTRKLLPAIERAGIDHLMTRSLRHGHLAALVDCNVPAMVTKTRMGHRQFGTTFNVYGHQLPWADQDAADALDARYSRSNGDATGTQSAIAE